MLTTLCVLALALPVSILSQQISLSLPPYKTSVLSSATDAFIESLLAEWNTPGGVSVAVVQQDYSGNWRVETKGYGNASLDGTPMTDRHLFGIASNSKLFNIIATGLLISNESVSPRLSWDTKIASIVPEWELMDPLASTDSTIMDLMSHRTGLPRHDLMYGRTDNISSIIKRMKYLKPSAGFREVYQYNNNMYMTLSYLPELVLPHRPTVARYVKKFILEPLGMNSTTYSINVAKASGNMAQGMARQDMRNALDMGTPREMWFPNWFLDGGEDGNFKAGAGGVISNAQDAAVWLQTLLLKGKNPKTMRRVIPEAVVEMVATGVTVDQGRASYPELSPVVYGGGQMRYSYRGHEIIEHGGSTTGFKTQISRFPSARLGIAVFSNDDEYGSMLHQIIKWYLADVALGLEPIDWDTRMKGHAIADFNSLRSRSRPINPPSPSLALSELSGSYENDGYGPIELCLLNGELSSNSFSASHSTSCSRVVAEASETLPGTITNTSVPTFLARWDKAWSSHVLLEHFTGNVFNLTALESRRIPNIPEVKFWAAPFHSGETAEFAIQDGRVQGLAFTCGFWGAGAGVGAPKGADLRERAEVWFNKM